MQPSDRLNAAYDWWISDEVTRNGDGPTVEQWLKMIRGLKVLSEVEDAPPCLKTALVIAQDRTVRTWAMIEICLYAAIHGLRRVA